MGLHLCFLLLLWLPWTASYIRRSGQEPDCPDIRCYNNGSLQVELCTCLCTAEYTGVFCGTEIKRSSWPRGSYSLISTVFGCPEEDEYGWYRGYINASLHVQGTQLWKMPRPTDDQHTADPHILGPYHYYTLQLNFCTRRDGQSDRRNQTMSEVNVNTETQDEELSSWPRGYYCIFQSGEYCPEGFAPGSVVLEGYNVSVSDTGGDLPYRVVDETGAVVLRYCCREDGDVTTPTTLPGDYPFILIKMPTENCQEIYNMTVSEERFDFLAKIHWAQDGENHILRRIDPSHLSLGLCYYRPTAQRECYYESDRGYSYIGTQNFSASGRPCLNWLDVDAERYGKTHRLTGNFEKNQCRVSDDKYYGTNPECFVTMEEVEECLIPLCEEDASLEELGAHKPVYAVEHFETMVPEFAVDNDPFAPSFKSSRPRVKPWIQVDLEEFVEVHAVLVKRQNSTGCGRRLGMVSGEIRDFQISVSSDRDGYIYDYGRLLRPGTGWCALQDDATPYFQVDLIVPMVVQGFEIQGWSDGTEKRIVRIVTLEYGMDEANLTKYREDEHYRKFFATDETQTVEMIQRFILHHEIVARYLRINIVSYEGAPCLKMEIIGCPKRVIRDLTCSSPSIDYGFELLNRACFWVEAEDPGYYPDTIEECIETCEAQKCLQAIFRCPSCRMLIPTRYNRFFSPSFVSRFNHSYSITRLCVAGVSDNEDCNQLLSEPQLLQSPGYPFYYGHVTDCTWTIDFLDGTFIKVEVIDINLATPDTQISLQNTGWTDTRVGECSDHIYIGNTYIDAGTQNDYVGALLMSSYTYLLVRLHSCARYSRTDAEGFVFNISTSDLPGCGSASLDNTIHCEAPAAYITSPGYPARVKPVDRRWIIEGHIGEYVLLEFLAIDIWNEDESNVVSCPNNYVVVNDVSLNGLGTEKGRFCSTNNPRVEIKSSWHFMELRYFIEKSDAGTGFIAKYRIVNYVTKTFVGKLEACQQDWNFYNGKCYKIYKRAQGLSWLEAEDLCKKNDGHLVSMETEAETMFAHKLLTEDIALFMNETITMGGALLQSDLDFYVGLRFHGYSGSYTDMMWSDNTPVTFTSWFTSDASNKQPDGGSNEGCTFLRLASIHSVQNWHDVACSYDKINNYICEMDAEGDHNDTEGDVETSFEKFAFTPYDRLFNCSSGEAILETYTCDGQTDCEDGSDEFCSAECGPGMFHCSDDKCISISLLCNFHIDCEDGEDEIACVHSDCHDGEWRCSNDQCIPADQRCDAKHDCIDNSDEIDCAICTQPAFQCYDQRCIPGTRVCDGIIDCYGKFHEDEDGCTAETLESCVDWYFSSMKEDGMYDIKSPTSYTVHWGCKFIDNKDGSVTVQTLVHHIRESPILATPSMTEINIDYQSSESHIHALMSRSKCKQLFHVDCSYYGEEISWFGGLPRNDEKRIYNTDTSYICSCPYVNKCNNETCLCSNTQEDWYGFELNDWKTDIGYITSHEYLPIFGVKFEDVVDKKKLRITIGPLICKEVIGKSDCWDGVNSKDYHGTTTVTNSGLTCQHWSSQTPHYHYLEDPSLYPHDDSVIDAQNYCRDPDDEGAPWCYTLNPNVRWEYCDVDICIDNSTDCWDGIDSRMYDGNVSVTSNDIPCQSWSTQSPHSHNYTHPSLFPLDGSVAKAKNNCRDPNGAGYPWCYTINPYIRWEFCNIPRCSEHTSTELSFSGLIPTEIMRCSSGESTAAEVRCLLAFDEYGDVRGCRDMSHLQFCGNFTCPVNYFKCHDSYCISSELVCDGVSHCLSSEDEQHCDVYRQCKNQFRCHRSSVCIAFDHVCDSERNCPQGDDELLCNLDCPENCSCQALSAECHNITNIHFIGKNTNVSSFLRKLVLSNNNFDHGLTAFEGFPYLAELFLSECDVKEILVGLFTSLHNLITLDISFNNIKILKSNIFEGLNRLERISLIGNPIKLIEENAFKGLSNVQEIDLSGSFLKVILPGMFRGLVNIQKLNLSFNLVEKVLENSFQDLGKLTQLDLHGNKITTFNEGIFNYLESLSLLYTDSFTLCCVRPPSVSESSCFPRKDEFSSCADLMRQDVLRAFLWIIGLLALAGNTSALVVRLYFQRSTLLKTYGIFVTNLGIADLMMGLYLLILAIADVSFRGEYVWNDFHWRHGWICNLAGVLSTMASEGSVIFLCLISFDRLIKVKFPFGRFHISRTQAIIFCIASWIVLFCIALVPFLAPSYFKGKFFSRSAVCLALPLTRDRPAGWEYAVGIFIVFNFFTIILIAIAQIVIYHEIFTSGSRITSNKRKQDVTIARNLFLVVFTNFICLFPVGIMGVMALQGHIISGDVYAWIAVFVLPINSALNPFLYTLGSTINKKSKCIISNKIRSSSKQKSGEKASLKIKQLFDSNAYFIGRRQMWKTTLLDVINKRSVEPKECLIVALQVAKAVATLHQIGFVHGYLSLQQVIVSVKGEVISGVALRTSPYVGDEEAEFMKDVTDFGNLLKTLVRNQAAPESEIKS